MLGDQSITEPTVEQLLAEIADLNGVISQLAQDNILLQRTMNQFAAENANLRASLDPQEND